MPYPTDDSLKSFIGKKLVAVNTEEGNRGKMELVFQEPDDETELTVLRIDAYAFLNLEKEYVLIVNRKPFQPVVDET